MSELAENEVVTETSCKDQDSKVFCSLCATLIPNRPKYFMGEEVNAACEKCEDKDDIYDKEPPLPKKLVFRRHGFDLRPVKAGDLDRADRLPLQSNSTIIREPFPPPLPALTPLVNSYSNYHIKIMKGSLDWGGTCENCYRIEHNNYGCESCVWMKWYGQLHGYPDTNPAIYRRYVEEYRPKQ